MKRQRTVSVPLRSTISSSSIAFILLLIQQQQRLISAEEQVDVDDDEYYDSAGQQQDDYQATDDDTTNDSSGDDRIAKYSSQPKGVVEIQDYCSNNFVRLSQLSVLCDSPGAYYYGSKSYRASEVCMSGDKVKLEAYFSIPRGLHYDVIYLQTALGIYDQFQVVGRNSLCQLKVTELSSYSDGDDDYWRGDSTECPHPGEYKLSTSYTVPSITDYSFHYTPDIRLTFLGSSNETLGCVTSGPQAIHSHQTNRARNGTIVLGVALVLVMSVFGALLLASRMKKLREDKKLQPVLYPYFRTLENGQVVPVSRYPADNDDDDSSRVSVSHNRPII